MKTETETNRVTKTASKARIDEKGNQASKKAERAAASRKPPNADRYKPHANPTADTITKAVLQFLDEQGYAVWRQVNEGRYDPDRQAWYPHPNARRGVPDIIGFRRSDGRFIGVEVKAGADRLRDEQITFLDELHAAGGLSFVAHSFEQFRASFEKRGLGIDETTDKRVSLHPNV